MSEPSTDPTRRDLSDQLMDLAAEVAMLRESITTAAEWDTQVRTERQQLLDSTLVSVRRGQRIALVMNLVLVVTNLVLVGLVLWLLSRGR